MAIKLLESKYTEQNDVIQNVDDGALINFQAAGQRNGRIFGWQLVQAGNTITASAGVLLIQGFRLKNDAVTTIFTLSPSYPLPVSKETRYLYARITRTGDNATFIFRFTDSPSTAIQNNIERENGIHDYLLAHVTVDASGMVGLKNQIATITASLSTAHQNRFPDWFRSTSGYNNQRCTLLVSRQCKAPQERSGLRIFLLHTRFVAGKTRQIARRYPRR